MNCLQKEYISFPQEFSWSKKTTYLGENVVNEKEYLSAISIV